MEWIMAITPSLLVGLIMWCWTKKQTKRDTRIEKRASVRKEESLLGLELDMATAKIAMATALAVKRGKTNGEMAEAMEELDRVTKKYDDFLKRQAKEHILGDK